MYANIQCMFRTYKKKYHTRGVKAQILSCSWLRYEDMYKPNLLYLLVLQVLLLQQVIGLVEILAGAPGAVTVRGIGPEGI